MFKKFNLFIVVLMILGIPVLTSAADIQIDNSSSFLYPGYSKKISMDFQDATLVDVLKIFSQQTGMNLISAEGLATKRVTVYLDNVPVEQALEQVLRANNLTYELQPDSNIYIVKSMTQTDTELLTRVYVLKHANVTKSRIRATLKIVYKTDSENSQTVTEDSEQTSSSTSGGTDQNADGIRSAIQGILTAKGKVVEDARTNSLTVTDVASNFNNIETAIAKLDMPVPQVLIEVEMLEISKETGDKIGVKFGDTPLTFAGGERAVLYPWNQNAILAKGLFSFADSDVDEYTPGAVSATGMTALLQFLTTQSDTKNLARPRILTLSNQPAQIKISTDESVGVKQQTTSAQNLATSSSEAERIETGVFLTVTPQVDQTNRDITMAIVPKVITTRPSAVFSNNTFFRDPEERGSLSILRVKSGDTVVIGGLLREDRTTVTTKLPFLGDLPLLGGAFRHKDDTVRNRELVIFLTPHILDENTDPTSLRSRSLVREQAEPSSAPRAEEIEKALTKTEKKQL